eukprot:TRINITY_DN24792_c0_g2_i1.p1 TRINITY_DN24792_c0_g2~~TRINITY_DN24792_c0_g2_i1.p1  ORF type:complete len:256 (-),score=71.26 TRINITY_DN24792_c0_g2_i1:110-877(-)
MIRRPPRSTLSSSSAASDVYKRQGYTVTATLAPDDATIPVGFKKVHLIRHGEGEHNVAQREWRAAGKPGEPYTPDNDPDGVFNDAQLTLVGVQQAEALQPRAASLRPELMIVSPMRRATQTGLIGFGEQVRSGLNVVAHELCHERAGKHTCDKRLHLAELRAQFGADVDYSLIASEHDPYWGDGTVRESSQDLARRCGEFLVWLGSRPEQQVVVAAHSTFLFHLLNAALVTSEEDGRWFETGEMRTMMLEFTKKN